MKNTHLIQLSSLFVLLTTIIGCSKEGFLDYSDLEHTSDWLFPIAKTVVGAEQVSKLHDLKYDIHGLAIAYRGVTVQRAFWVKRHHLLLQNGLTELHCAL